MDYERFNPCGAEPFVRLLTWAETGCWCCSAVRALVVGLHIGSVFGLAAAGSWRGAVLFAVIGAPVVAGVLIAARRIWAESYKKEESE